MDFIYICIWILYNTIWILILLNVVNKNNFVVQGDPTKVLPENFDDPFFPHKCSFNSIESFPP